MKSQDNAAVQLSDQSLEDSSSSNFGKILNLYDPSQKTEGMESREMADELLETFKLSKQREKEEKLAKRVKGLEIIKHEISGMNKKDKTEQPTKQAQESSS